MKSADLPPARSQGPIALATERLPGSRSSGDKNRRDIYTEITNSIVKAIENGTDRCELCSREKSAL